MLVLFAVILVREVLTVIRKYLIENIATQTDKEQTVHVIDQLLKADIGGFLYQQQIGSLYGRIFRSIEGLISIIKLTFLDFTPVFFTAVAAIGIAFLQKPDRILVFEEGKIAQEGDFRMLSETKGIFQDFLLQKGQPTEPEGSEEGAETFLSNL